MNHLDRPYIIIGMHRSGTSFLVDVLEAGGIQMGLVQDHHGEAMHFLSINQRAMRAAGGSWLDPVVPPEEAYDPMQPLDLYLEHIKRTGRLARLSARFMAKPWGWKDPRNTFTLNHWLRLFPKARVIHLHRHPRSVVNSLMKRNEEAGEVRDPRLNNADFCYRLWQQYVEQALATPGAVHFGYEKLTAAEPESLAQLSGLLGSDITLAVKRLARPAPVEGPRLPETDLMRRLGYL